MNERLSRGQRTHNRLEKASARHKGRTPFLITAPHKPKDFPTSSDIFPLGNIPEIASFENQISFDEPIIRRRPARTLPSFDNIIVAGSTLSLKYAGLKREQEGERVYVSDMQAVRILERLEAAIESGQIVTHNEIAETIGLLGSKMGCMSSVTTEIDIQAYWVLEAIRKNSKKLS